VNDEQPAPEAAEQPSNPPEQSAVPANLPEQADAANPAHAGPVPRVHHAAPSIAPPHEALSIAAEIDHPHLVRHAYLVYRVRPSFLTGPATPEWTTVDFLRGSPGPYVATIPESDVRPPGLEYAIELELVDGRRESVFANRAAPQSVTVVEDLMDIREHAALERLGGRRSVVAGTFEFVNFVKGDLRGPGADWYYRTEGSYTFRPLRAVDEFSVHVGVVRGRSPGNEDKTVGLNYGSAYVRFRASDLVRLEGELLTSVTEVGFSAGAGGAIDIGDPYGSKLKLGFESVAVFGSRFYSQVDIQASPKLRITPIVEATDMPHAGRYGVRLLGEVAYDLGGFAVVIRGGYQARDAASGGFGAGLGLNVSF
jgi:hypothetical protein